VRRSAGAARRLHEDTADIMSLSRPCSARVSMTSKHPDGSGKVSMLVISWCDDHQLQKANNTLYPQLPNVSRKASPSPTKRQKPIPSIACLTWEYRGSVGILRSSSGISWRGRVPDERIAAEVMTTEGSCRLRRLWSSTRKQLDDLGNPVDSHHDEIDLETHALGLQRGARGRG